VGIVERLTELAGWADFRQPSMRNDDCLEIDDQKGDCDFQLSYRAEQDIRFNPDPAKGQGDSVAKSPAILGNTIVIRCAGR
jgi:hypothetical protein